jgi:DNA-binding LacI/PurR family transcriptional regulator
MDDIARLANVSKPTVSRALADSPLVKEDTRNRVLAVAHEHGYAVNRNAQKLRRKRTNTIAVSLDYRSHRENHISDPFMFDLLAGVSEALGDRDQDLLLCAPGHNDAEAFQKILWSRGADGFIILGQGHREAMLNEFAATGTPFVVWGAAAQNAGYCVVGSDNFLGGRLAGQYLLAHGRRRLLFVGDTSFREMQQRFRGLEHTAGRCDAEVTVDHIDLNYFSYGAAHVAAQRYLEMTDHPANGVFACSDTVAMAFISAYAQTGIQVPGDASIVGYNDIPQAAHFSPQLTTIRQDIHQAGRLLVGKLMRMLDGDSPRSATIKTELIARES